MLSSDGFDPTGDPFREARARMVSYQIRARGINDGSRMFVAGLLLDRGYLQKVSARSAEFSRRLYEVITDGATARESAGPRAGHNGGEPGG